MSMEETGTKGSQNGVISFGDHYRQDNVHLVSSVPALDTVWLEQDRPIEKLVYLPTAADRFPDFEYSDYFVDQERSWISDQLARGTIERAEELTLIEMSLAEIETALRSSDMLLMGAGNTPYLLETLQKTRAAELIAELVRERNLLYLGRCAGAVVAGPDISERGTFWPSLALGELEDTSGLGLVDVYPIPHIDSLTVLTRRHSISGKTGQEVADEMAKNHSVVLLTDQLDIPTQEAA